ncbi:thiolase family protein [Planctellipticum variicoloris]|uniref:thiolase family protein n=1 Tax=Planctellipticum variicoloris TaxID=3064265 RepID=UPI0030140917|nr:thiolase family protein [Planctomycetaceae bacterium SH412]
MTRIVICAARRTPFGKFRGGLAMVGPVELATAAGRAVLRDLNPAGIDLVVLGNVLAAGHGMNIARQVGVQLGLPLEVPAYTVNMMCASGLQSVLLGAQAIRAGEARAVLCGGVESMSQSPLLVSRPAPKEAPDVATAVDSMLRDGLVDSFSHRHMGETVEDLAAEYGITRAEQDAFAARSQRNWAAAQAAGRFADELVPLNGLEADEHPRPQSTEESLASLRTVFRPDGTITAGNASGVNDGAAVLLLADSEWAKSQGWPALAEFELGGVVGCDPQRMGLGPVHALRGLVARRGGAINDFDTLELNEAFAAQSLACLRELGLSADGLERGRPVVNPDGGAIALGHPIGASGARLLTHLAWRIARGESNRAAAALCVGGGMGIAAAVKTA